MKTPPLFALLLAGLACTFALRSVEARQGKPPAEWNDKDIRQILEHSPWAHRAPVLLVRPEGEGKPCMGSKGPCAREDTFHPPDTSNSIPSPAANSHDLVTQVRNSELQKEYSGGPEAEAPGAADGVAGVAVVRWASARTVRDALARMLPPSGKRLEEEQLAPLAAVDAYVLYVDLRVGLPDVSRIAQNGVFTEQMARRSFLVLKSSGQRLPAVRVVSAPLPEFDERKELAIAGYYIFFPRRKGDRPAIPPGESEVRFECPLTPVPIRADFKLSRMVREGSPDY